MRKNGPLESKLSDRRLAEAFLMSRALNAKNLNSADRSAISNHGYGYDNSIGGIFVDEPGYMFLHRRCDQIKLAL